MKTIIKAIIAIAMMGLISFNTNAQKTNDVPQAILTSFSYKYPQAQLKNWKEKEGAYVASFTMDNKKYRACYSKDGNWLNTEREIKHTSDLPADLRSYLKTSTYASWKIDDMKRVHTPSQDMYQVLVDNHGGNSLRYEDAVSAEDRLLSFDDGGKLINVKEL
ncbi:MAG TPA: PepSY-like domain-containing protein [Mucilaginibacter sp.]